MGYDRNKRGNYRGSGGGGTKDFKADPIKQFLISRGSARDRAVELCCAGKIPLEDIPMMSDKLTVLHFGKIQVDPKVDAEVMRIAARLRDKMDKMKAAEPKEPEEQNQDAPEFDDLCCNCIDFSTCDVTPEERPVEACGTFYHKDDAEADAALKRQQEAEDRQRAEEEHNAQQQQECEPEAKEPAPENNKADEYQCGTCGKVYKTAAGLGRHVQKTHQVG